MPLPPVVIELPPRDVASEQAQVLLRACSAAVVDGECRLADSYSGAPRAVAIVSWSGEYSRARIELGIKAGAARWRERRLEFKPADPVAERWKSVGLVIGALVGEAEQESKPKPPKPAPESPAPKPVPAPVPSAKPEPPPPPPPELATIFFDAGAVVGPGMSSGRLRLGGEVGLGGRSGPVLILLHGRYQARPERSDEVTLHWASGSLGAGVLNRITPWFSLELTAHAVAERVEASISEPPTDSASRWAFGGRVRGAGALWLTPQAAVVAGAEATALTSGTEITVEDQNVGRVPPLNWGLWAGVRLGMF